MNIFDLRKLGVAVMVVLLVSFAATGFAQKVTDYTADQVTMGADGKPIKQSKVYFSDGKMRIDDVMPQSGAKLIMIYRSDLKKNFMRNSTCLSEPARTRGKSPSCVTSRRESPRRLCSRSLQATAKSRT